MVSRVLRKLANKIRPERRIHCFCLGAAKTGTTSFASMFKFRYRSAHEPETVALLDAVAKVIDGKSIIKSRPVSSIAQEDSASLDVSAWLKSRDRRLNLEVEASHPLGYMAPWLPVVFPDARFVITIRDPLSWLKSRLNFHYYKSPPEWQRYRDLIWSRWHRGYHNEEKILQEMGLYSIDAYLSQYAEQYDLLYRHIPEQKRLIVRTEELNTAAEKIGDFLSIDPISICPQHANAFSHDESVIDRISEEFVAWRIEANCQVIKALI